MAAEKTYYEILDLTMKATPDEIRKAYRKRASECHPDKVSNLDVEIRDLAEAKMMKINEAYNVLGNEAQRAEYDHWISVNKDIIVNADGSIGAEPVVDTPQPGLSADQLIAKLEGAIIHVKAQILATDPTIKWKETSVEGFDTVLEGSRRIERYFIYLNTVDTLRPLDVEAIIANSTALSANSKFLLNKKYSLFLVLYLDSENDDKIRSEIRDFNNFAISQAGGRRAGVNMVAMINIASGELYFPYVKGFQPDLQGLALPQDIQ
jgi:curved DNA-binding protein CbpA